MKTIKYISVLIWACLCFDLTIEESSTTPNSDYVYGDDYLETDEKTNNDYFNAANSTSTLQPSLTTQVKTADGSDYEYDYSENVGATTVKANCSGESCTQSPSGGSDYAYGMDYVEEDMNIAEASEDATPFEKKSDTNNDYSYGIQDYEAGSESLSEDSESKETTKSDDTTKPPGGKTSGGKSEKSEAEKTEETDGGKTKGDNSGKASGGKTKKHAGGKIDKRARSQSDKDAKKEKKNADKVQAKDKGKPKKKSTKKSKDLKNLEDNKKKTSSKPKDAQGLDYGEDVGEDSPIKTTKGIDKTTAKSGSKKTKKPHKKNKNGGKKSKTNRKGSTKVGKNTTPPGNAPNSDYQGDPMPEDKTPKLSTKCANGECGTTKTKHVNRFLKKRVVKSNSKSVDKMKKSKDKSKNKKNSVNKPTPKI